MNPSVFLELMCEVSQINVPTKRLIEAIKCFVDIRF